MHTFLTIPPCRHYVAAQRQAGRTLCFVPTMGALHEAHLSLMRRSVEENDTTLISIFVNPTQFGPGEDYQQYHRDLARDSALAAGVGVDAIFAPSPATMYPPGAGTYIDQGGATVATLEGLMWPLRAPFASDHPVCPARPTWRSWSIGRAGCPGLSRSLLAVASGRARSRGVVP